MPFVACWKVPMLVRATACAVHIYNWTNKRFETLRVDDYALLWNAMEITDKFSYGMRLLTISTFSRCNSPVCRLLRLTWLFLEGLYMNPAFLGSCHVLHRQNVIIYRFIRNDCSMSNQRFHPKMCSTFFIIVIIISPISVWWRHAILTTPTVLQTKTYFLFVCHYERVVISVSMCAPFDRHQR